MRRLPTAYYHVIPLHFVPHLLATGALYSPSRLAQLNLPIQPRRTAAGRDRKLRLDRFVRCSLAPNTPLLADKCRRGYPHLRLVFDVRIADLPGAGFVRYNAKAWRHREDFTPITDPAGKSAFLAEWQTGHYPSAELVVPDELPLSPCLTGIEAPGQWEKDWLTQIGTVLSLDGYPEAEVTTDRFPPLAAYERGPYERYADACRDAGKVVTPPALPFD